MATQTRTPTGFTSVAGANPASTGTQLAAVQTAGDGIYVQVQNNGNAFYCTHASFAVPSDATVNFVRITPTVRGADGNTCTCVTAEYIGTTYASSAQSVATTTWTELDFNWPVNPATSAAWTPAAVNALTRMYVQAPDAAPDLWVDHVQVTVDYTEAGTGASITPADASHGHTSGHPSVAQPHAVMPSAGAHAHAATSPTVSATVGPSGSTHAHVAGSPSLAQSHALAPADSSHGQVVTSPTLAQAVSVSPTPGMHVHTTTTPVVSQSHVMAPAGSVHGHAATTPALSIPGDPWRLALASAIAGTGTARIGYIGDSYFEGVGASDRAHRWIDQLDAMLRTQHGIGGQAQWHSGYWFDGPGGDTDPTTTGAQSTSDAYLGRRGVVLDAGEYIEWPITGRYLDLFSAATPGGSLVLSVGGATLATWTADGSTRRHDFGTSTSRTVRVAATGATVGVHGIIEYTTTPTAGLNYIECTRGGATSAYWAPGTGAVSAMRQASPDLLIWSLYGNDFLPSSGWAAPSVVASRFTAFLADVATWPKVPRVALLLYWGLSYDGPNDGGYRHGDYRSALRAVATANAVQIIDMSDEYNPAPTGWVIADGVHPNSTGHQKIAEYIAGALPGPYGVDHVAPLDAEHAQTATEPSVEATHLLVGGAGLHAHSASIPTVTQAHTVTPAPGICGHTATSPTSTQVASVSPAGATHAHAGTTPTVTQTHTIAPTAGTHSQTATAPTLGLAHVITPSDATHAQTVATPTTRQAHRLSPATATHAHTATIPTSVVATLIHPEGSSHAHGVTSAAITQAHRIAAHAAGHAHAAGVPTVATRHVITPHGCIHGQTAAPSGWRDLTVHVGHATRSSITTGTAARRDIAPVITLGSPL